MLMKLLSLMLLGFPHRFASFTDAPSAAVALWLTGVIFKADSDLSNPISAHRGPRSRGRSKLSVGRACDNKSWQISQNKPRSSKSGQSTAEEVLLRHP